MRVGGCSRNCVLTRGSAPRPRTLHPIACGAVVVVNVLAVEGLVENALYVQLVPPSVQRTHCETVVTTKDKPY